MTSGRTFNDGEDTIHEFNNGIISEVLDLQNETISCNDSQLLWISRQINGQGIYLNGSVVMICGGDMLHKSGNIFPMGLCNFVDLSRINDRLMEGLRFKDQTRSKFSMVGLNGKIRSNLHK